MKDLVNLKYFLSIKVLRSKQGIFISQRKYILDLLTKTGMLDCKAAKTLIIVNHGLQTLIILIYLSHTRPDIAYVVGVIIRFMHLSQTQHMEAVMRILRYLKGTIISAIICTFSCYFKLLLLDFEFVGVYLVTFILKSRFYNLALNNINYCCLL